MRTKAEIIEYIKEHNTEYEYGAKFPQKIAKKFKKSVNTIKRWMSESEIKVCKKSDKIVTTLMKNPNVYTAKELAKELNVSYATVMESVARAELQDLLLAPNKWDRVSISAIKGKTYRELMEKFNIKSWSAMSHIAQRAGWDKYLKKTRGRNAPIYTKDAVRALSRNIDVDNTVETLRKLQSKINSEIKFTKDGSLNETNFEKCKTSVAISIAILTLMKKGV